MDTDIHYEPCKHALGPSVSGVPFLCVEKRYLSGCRYAVRAEATAHLPDVTKLFEIVSRILPPRLVVKTASLVRTWCSHTQSGSSESRLA